ncbi:MAG: N-acetyl sugar amidotransferase [Acidobacteria bacterium]|nr:N-acetyl sugar amidotransferase [Acidobacteriota bacterium]
MESLTRDTETSTPPKVLHGLPETVIFCKRCVMSNQRPSTSPELRKRDSRIETAAFGEDGICHACRFAELKATIDWQAREEQLLRLLDRYRRSDGGYDVVVPGSGGKDSAYVSHVLRERYGMNPLTVTWAPHIYTDIGWRNFQAWMHVGGLNNLLFTPNPRIHGVMTRLAFLNLLNPFQPFIIGQKNLAPQIALKYGVKLIMYGENQAEYHNKLSETQSPLMSPDHYTGQPGQKYYFGGVHQDELGAYGIHRPDLEPYLPISLAEAESGGLELHYMSYYHRWVPQENYYYAVEHCGFEPNPERSEGTYSKYASLDDRIDGFHYYTMFIKFGQGRAMNDAAHEIRDGHITREEAVALVHKYDGEFPKKYFGDFLEYTGLTEDEFWQAIDRNRSPHLWAKRDGEWVLLHQVS